MADADAPVTTPLPPRPDPARDAASTRPTQTITTPIAAVIAVVTTIVGLIVLAWGVLYVTKGRFLKHPFEHIVGGLTHRDVSVKGDFQLYFDPFDIKFVAQSMRVSNPAWATKPDLFKADAIDARIAPLSMLFGKRHFRWLTLANGAIDLEWNAAHTTNTWTFGPATGGKPLDFPRIDRAVAAGTTVRYRDPRMQLLADIGIETIKSTNARIGDAVHFSGGGMLRTTPFTVSGALLSPDATVARGHNRLEMVADAAHNHITVSGDLPSLADVENVPLQTTAKGRNIADLLGIIGVVVPQTRAYSLKARMVKDDTLYSFTHMTGRFGDSDLAGSFSVDNVRPRIQLKANLTTRTLDIVDLAPFIGYDPNAIASKGKAGAIVQVGGHPRLLPDAPLKVEALKNFDATLDYTARTLRAKSLPISNIALKLSLDNSLLKLSPLTFDMARGHLSSDITIDARRNPVFTDYDIRLSPTPMGVLLAGFGVEQSGTSGTLSARIKMSGSGNSLHDSLASSNGRIAIVIPQGTFWTRNAQLAELDLGTFVQKMFEHELKKPVEINCGLIGFTVRNGVAAADPILIDTSKNVMLGRGGFSFRNEALDLAFRADGKKFSLFSGQSPVGIAGYFAKPSIDVVSPQLIGRAGAALGLALVATPIAGVLAFVDVGDAKSAACGPVLAGATAAAQRTTKGQPRDDVGHGTTATAENGKQSKGDAEKQHKKFLGIF
ncbi:AsmA family protein [Sphingomonas koreensis]|nr:AsmA family protein [Sphingomonas koreensis]